MSGDCVAVVGLGPIGGGMAGRIIQGGFTVLGVEPDPNRAKEWGETHGQSAVASVADLNYSRVGVLVIAVRLEDQILSVLANIPEHARVHPVALVVVTTVTVEFARELPGRLPPLWTLVECPVSGGEWGAREGTLSVYIAGEVTSLVERVLNATSAKRFVFTNFGDPASAKLLNNALAAYNAVATAHFLNLASQQGLDRGHFLEVVCSSSGQSWMSDHFLQFPDDLLFKDVDLLRRSISPLPGVSLADAGSERQLIESARNVMEK